MKVRRSFEMSGQPCYEYEADGKCLRVRNAKPTDECWTGEQNGHLNVSAMWRDIAEGRTDGCEFIVAELDATLVHHMARRELDKTVLARITPERAELPALAFSVDGKTDIVDGAHRIKWRADHGFDSVRLIVFPESSMERYRVRMFWRVRFEWQEITAEEALRMTLGTFPILNDEGEMIGLRREGGAS